MIIVGIDPGKKGGITILNTYKYREITSIALEKITLMDAYMYLSEIRGGEPARRARHVENISDPLPLIRQTHRTVRLADEDTYDNSMEIWLEEPGQIIVNSRTKGKDATGAILAGMTASRKLGRAVGQWEGIAIALSTPVVYVSPKTWQSAMNCNTKGDKSVTRNKAAAMYPFLVDKNGKSMVTDAIADSILIATYGYINYAEPKYIPVNIAKRVDIDKIQGASKDRTDASSIQISRSKGTKVKRTRTTKIPRK